MSEVGEQDVSRTRTATQTSDSSSRCEAAFDSSKARLPGERSCSCSFAGFDHHFVSSQPSRTACLNPSWKTPAVTLRGCAVPPEILHRRCSASNLLFGFGFQKLEDGTITVSEFLKLFNIDFVIHNPRQSVLPSRVGSVFL